MVYALPTTKCASKLQLVVQLSTQATIMLITLILAVICTKLLIFLFIIRKPTSTVVPTLTFAKITAKLTLGYNILAGSVTPDLVILRLIITSWGMSTATTSGISKTHEKFL